MPRHIAEPTPTATVVRVCLVVSAMAFFYSLAIQWSDLFDPNAFHGDTRQEIYWMYRLENPTLFPGDRLADHSEAMAPWGLYGFYFAAVKFAGAIVIAKSLSLFLCAGFACFMTLLLMRLNLRPTSAAFGAWLAVLVLWAKSTASFGVGDSEDFVPLFLALFLWGHVAERRIAEVAALILLALFYPPALLVCLLTIALGYISWEKWRALKLFREKATYFYIGIAVLCVALVAGKFLFNPYDPGPLPDRATMKGMEEFGPDGRTVFFYSTFFEQMTNLRSGLSIEPLTLAIVILAIILGLLSYRRFKETEVGRLWRFGLAALILFVAAHVVLLKLFSPSRYLRLPLPILACIVIAVSIDRLVVRRVSSKTSMKIAVPVFVLMVVLFYPLTSNSYRHVDPNPVYKRIASLPNTAMIAAFPTTADNIPILTRRSVYINDEMASPFFLGYYAWVKKRVERVIDAYYAPSWERIEQFCHEENVTHFLIQKEHFRFSDTPNGPDYHAPFEKRIAEIAHGNRTFAAIHPPPDRTVYEDGEYLLYRCD